MRAESERELIPTDTTVKLPLEVAPGDTAPPSPPKPYIRGDSGFILLWQTPMRLLHSLLGEGAIWETCSQKQGDPPSKVSLEITRHLWIGTLFPLEIASLKVAAFACTPRE